VDNQPGAPQPPQFSPAQLDTSPALITNRSDLIQALCDAAQLEHGLCCAYLYAAFSIKRRPEEGVPSNRLADLREWESVLLLIARQEMEHLGIVCNLLTSVGGMPYLQNPTFPIAMGRYGSLPALPLQQFSKETIQRFIAFESPEWVLLGATILKRIQSAANYSAALVIACQQICAEAQWVSGDVWAPKDGTMVPAARADRELSIPYDPGVGKDLWARWQMPHAPRGEALQTPRAVGSGYVNTFIEIPSYRGSELKCVWRFFYETFRSFDEDDTLAETIELMLGGPGPNALRDKLDDLAERTVLGDTGLRPVQPRYATIGAFYRQIRKGFLRLCFRDHKPTGQQLFTGFQTGNPEIGIGDRSVHDMDLLTVSGLNSALAAIDQIIETGEACFNRRVASHYVRLNKLLEALDSAMTLGPFEPARATVKNPMTAQPKEFRAAGDYTLLEHPDALAVGEIFNATYEIMLQMVARFFAFPDDKVLEGMAFGPLMTMAIRPLAEILTEFSARPGSDQKAGPPFQSPTRDLLHPHRLAAWTVFGERLQEIAATCELVEKNLQPEHQQAGQRLAFISKNVNFIALRLKTAVEQAKAGTLNSGAVSAGSTGN
jgi:ferritin-like protein